MRHQSRSFEKRNIAINYLFEFILVFLDKMVYKSVIKLIKLSEKIVLKCNVKLNLSIKCNYI